jgi:hypothetical protein
MGSAAWWAAEVARLEVARDACKPGTSPYALMCGGIREAVRRYQEALAAEPKALERHPADMPRAEYLRMLETEAASMTPEELEPFVAAWLRRQGYTLRVHPRTAELSLEELPALVEGA